MNDLITIYALTDPDNSEVRYVGKTVNVHKRHAMHLVMGRASLVGKWVHDLDQRGKVPGLKVLEDSIPISRASTREHYWIAYWRDQGASLLNWKHPPRQPHVISTQDHPLRLWREAHNLSQQEVADACQLTQAMISYIESDKKLPWREALERLRAYTGMPLDAFLRWREFLQEVGGEKNFLRRYGPKRKR